MTQISRSLLAEPQAGQAWRLCWKLVGRVLTAGWAVGLGVPSQGLDGLCQPGWWLTHYVPSLSGR